MLDIKFIREHEDEVKKNCKNRYVKCDIDQLMNLDRSRLELIKKIEDLRSEKNKLNEVIKSVEDKAAIIKKGKIIKEQIENLEPKLSAIEKDFHAHLLTVPNMTHPDVKVSNNEDDNQVMEVVKEPIKFDFEPLDHVQIGKNLDLIDFERATKVSGAKFYYFKNELVFVEQALINYALNVAASHGFIPFTTPDLAKKEVLEGLGFNPRGEETQVYNIEDSDSSLIGTAEITMGGYHMNEVLDEKDLPKKYVALSHCYRTEAGAYSKFSKGIFRVHQFTKVEMFQYVMPEKSEEAHKEILEIEKEIFKGLGIPFRVVDHCTADLGGPSIRTFDLEAWMPGKPNQDGTMGDWGEITSTSNCTDYQSRGLNIKYKTQDGEKGYVHMLNGTAIAVTRALIAIAENYQQADGSVVIPEVLRKYMPGNMEIISKK
ncbi:MAG TPA: serine--tRNA ligase [Candidatus Moranbacteria bacterium]|nr:serine--tRNA ligase [Candidatus Moranbacteria bacterium]HSA08571.1 serine--tRNA ligase [Candidatus Moranbacteria bacterium]